jgi:hypothetical protein
LSGVRVVCVEAAEAGVDSFLDGVVSNLQAAGVRPVRLAALSDDAAVKRIAKIAKHVPLESLDLVGHGASGLLHVGATAAGEFTDDDQYATLDADLRKVASLEWIHEAIAARRKKGGQISPTFAVRLLGCEVGVNPGQLEGDARLNVADGAVLIHFVASHLDVPVEAPLDLIFAADFATGEYAGAPTRRCTVHPDGRVTFKRVRYGARKPAPAPLRTLVSPAPPSVLARRAPARPPTPRVEDKSPLTLPPSLAPAVCARLPRLVRELSSRDVGLCRDALLAEAEGTRVFVVGGGRYVLIEGPSTSYLGRLEHDVLSLLGRGWREVMSRAERQRAKVSRLPPDEPAAP